MVQTSLFGTLASSSAQPGKTDTAQSCATSFSTQNGSGNPVIVLVTDGRHGMTVAVKLHSLHLSHISLCSCAHFLTRSWEIHYVDFLTRKSHRGRLDYTRIFSGACGVTCHKARSSPGEVPVPFLLFAVTYTGVHFACATYIESASHKA